MVFDALTQALLHSFKCAGTESKGVEAMRALVSQAVQCAGFVSVSPFHLNTSCASSVSFSTIFSPPFQCLRFFSYRRGSSVSFWSYPSAYLGSRDVDRRK